MNTFEESDRNLLVIQKRELIEKYRFTPSELNTIISLIDDPNPNREIIDDRFMPKLIVPVCVTNTEKYVVLPPTIEYHGHEAVDIPDHPGWKWISAPLSAEDIRLYITVDQKLGNGTAWEQGLQLHGEKSTPEWQDLCDHLKEFSVPDPNYPKHHSNVRIIPSIIYPPPGLRREFALLTGDEYTGTPLELRITRRHEESHIAEMILLPWPAGADQIDGFKKDGAECFLQILETNKIHINKMEFPDDLLTPLLESSIFPRSYLGEFQAYLGDDIYLLHHAGISETTYSQIIASDIVRAKILWRMKPHRLPKNYFGAIMADIIVRSVDKQEATRLLNDIYSIMQA